MVSSSSRLAPGHSHASFTWHRSSRATRWHGGKGLAVYRNFMGKTSCTKRNGFGACQRLASQASFAYTRHIIAIRKETKRYFPRKSYVLVRKAKSSTSVAPWNNQRRATSKHLDRYISLVESWVRLEQDPRARATERRYRKHAMTDSTRSYVHRFHSRPTRPVHKVRNVQALYLGEDSVEVVLAQREGVIIFSVSSFHELQRTILFCRRLQRKSNKKQEERSDWHPSRAAKYQELARQRLPQFWYTIQLLRHSITIRESQRQSRAIRELPQ